MATTEEIRAAPDAAGSRQEAGEYLEALGLTRAGLTDLARELSCHVTARDKAGIRRQAIEATVWHRLDIAAIRSGNW
jgi:hypothetical protein